jgi:protein-disulfide isomerase
MPMKSHKGKIIALVVLLLIAGVGGFGYFKQANHLETEEKASEVATAAAQTDLSVLTMRPNDIIVGDVNALVTIVEYSSLSCSHCQHFHQKVLPDIQKEFITPGKVKLVIRHFPLNDPALKASTLVECAGAKGNQRSSFLEVLFENQAKWAFSDDFMKNLKQIALVGGIDSAAFESCMADKDLENRILMGRIEGAQKLGITSTPTFFVNGTKVIGASSIDVMRTSINAALEKTK